MKEQYFLITTNEDGDVSLRIYDDEERLQEQFDVEETGEELHHKIWDDEDEDLSASTGHIIIRGKLVTPKPVEIVRGWDFSK
jgi:hypothetical protein